MSDDGFSSEDERRIWLHYAYHALALVKVSEELRVVPLWKAFSAPQPAAEYGLRAIGEIRRCMRGTPYLRRRDLKREAKKFQSLTGWRAAIPTLAGNFEKALRALASAQVPGRPGSPQRKLGETRIRERRLARQALDELTKVALAHGRWDWVDELYKPGTRKRPSQGRALWARCAQRLAQKDGGELSPTKLTEQIRALAKSRPRINYFARLAERRPPKPRLIKPRWA